MDLETIKISKIKLNPKNPRVIKDDEFENLKRSLKDFPEMLKIRPVVLDEHGMILGGDKRLAAWKDLGNKEIEIIRFNNLTDKKKREFILRDNHHSGEWSEEILREEWDQEELDEWGMTPKFVDKEPMEKKKLNTTPYNKVHVMLSFSPDKLLQIQELLEALQSDPEIEYEQSAN